MKARFTFSATILTLLLSNHLYAQTRDFSSAHKKIERALEGAVGFPGSDAIWVKHNALLIAVAKGAVNEKNMPNRCASFSERMVSLAKKCR